MRPYRPAELLDADGRPVADILARIPDGTAWLGSIPHADGGLLLRAMHVPTLDGIAVPVDKPGTTHPRVLGDLLTRDQPPPQVPCRCHAIRQTHGPPRGDDRL